MMKPKLYPKFETTPSGWYNKITKVEHPFLQKLVDMKALVILMAGEFTVYAGDLVGVLLFVHAGSVELECIAVDPDKRNKGQASNIMKALVNISNDTGIPITLRTANVSGNGWNIAQHPVIAMGMVKKGKIPVAKLKKFYEKFGFKTVQKLRPVTR